MTVGGSRGEAKIEEKKKMWPWCRESQHCANKGKYDMHGFGMT
jgi:hypothetical protein